MKHPFLTGLLSHPHAIRLLISQPDIRRHATKPLLINILLFALGIPLAVFGATELIDTLVGDTSGWASALVVILQILAALTVIFLGFLLFGIIGAAIAGPFSGQLSEAVEAHERERLGLPPIQVHSRGVVRDIGRGVFFTFGRLLLFLAVYPLIFILKFIPVIGPFLFAILAFLYSSFVLSVDFTDPTSDRYLSTFRKKVAWVWHRKALYLGFGAGCVALLMVPVVNLAMIPVCVVAGAVVWVGECRENSE